MASESTADPCAKRRSLEEYPPSKRAKRTDDETMDWLSGGGPDLLGVISTYLGLGLELTNMVVALAAGRQAEGKDIAGVVKRVYFRGNDYYLDRLFSSLPTGYDRNLDKIRRAREKLREWMGMNPDWEDRVVAPGSEVSSGLHTRVSVPGLLPIKGIDATGPSECVWRLVEEVPHLPGVERGSLLIDEHYENEHIELIFMKARDALFNYPRLVVKLGLVEILSDMTQKGAVDADTMCEVDVVGHKIPRCPILWNSYYASVDSSCLTYLLSLEAFDCNRRHEGETLLHHASICNRLPLGIDAYRSLALHPTTDVNAQKEHDGISALHNILIPCKAFVLDIFTAMFDFEYLEAVHRIKVLLDAGANPLVRSHEHGTAIDILADIRGRSRRLEFGNHLSEEQLDEIEAMMREASSRM